MLILFLRTIMPDSSVRVKTEGVIDGEHREIGTLHFPSGKTWAKFWGAIQRGALNIQDLEVKLENLTLTDEAPHEIE